MMTSLPVPETAPLSARTALVVAFSLTLTALPGRLAADIQLVIKREPTPVLAISGPPGTVCQVQWSDDLADPARWFHLGHWVLTTAVVQIGDPTAVGATGRFYRAVQTPTTNVVLIPAAPFAMGDTFSEGNSDELPLHTIRVSAFYMDRIEVTKAVWDDVYTWASSRNYAFANAGSAKASNHPVHSINWFDAVKWCNARSEREELTPCYYADTNFTQVYKTAYDVTNAPYVMWSANGYRLPTEAEWEKAARAGAAGRRFPWADSDDITHTRANYYSLASPALPYDTSASRGYHPTYRSGGVPYTAPVGAFAPNAYGVFDLAGNVQEWGWDAYEFGWYGQPGAIQANSRGPSGPVATRVVRGGSWNQNANYSRCADRFDESPSNALNVIGFRCVRLP